MYLTKECLGQAQFDCCPPTDDDLHDKLANYLLMKAIFFNNLINKGAKIRNRDPNQKVIFRVPKILFKIFPGVKFDILIEVAFIIYTMQRLHLQVEQIF